MTGDLDAMFAEWRDVLSSERYEHQDHDEATTSAEWVPAGENVAAMSTPPTPGGGLGCPLVSALGFTALMAIVVVVVQVVTWVTP